METRQFFMVYGMNQGAPTVRHESLAEATREAERLARANPGIDFYVLAAISRSRKVDVETEVLVAEWPAAHAALNPDDIPF